MRSYEDGGGHYPVLTYNGVDVPIRTPGLKTDYATAIRPGEQEAFDQRCVASLPKDAADQIVKEHQSQVDAQAAEKRARDDAVRAKFEEAKKTNKPVALKSWSENRRAKEGGEWGDYAFIVTRYANPDGTTSESAINTY